MNVAVKAVYAAQRQRDDLCACVLHGSVDQVERILAGTKDKAGLELVSADYKRIFHVKNSFFLDPFKGNV